MLLSLQESGAPKAVVAHKSPAQQGSPRPPHSELVLADPDYYGATPGVADFADP